MKREGIREGRPEKKIKTKEKEIEGREKICPMKKKKKRKKWNCRT